MSNPAQLHTTVAIEANCDTRAKHHGEMALEGSLAQSFEVERQDSEGAAHDAPPGTGRGSVGDDRGLELEALQPRDDAGSTAPTGCDL
jgi:hypothetical protein